MAIDMTQFDIALTKVEAELEADIKKAITKVVLAVDAAVVLATPVDTGRARANWQPTLESPAIENIEQFDKGGTEAINKCRSKMKDFKLGQTVYISNNLPYIGALNDGHSKQAPAGFIFKAVQIAKDALK